MELSHYAIEPWARTILKGWTLVRFYYNQQIEIRYYNMFRSYGTITLRNRALGSNYFVRLDFSPVLFQHRIIANADAREIPIKTGVISNHRIV